MFGFSSTKQIFTFSTSLILELLLMSFCVWLYVGKRCEKSALRIFINSNMKKIAAHASRVVQATVSEVRLHGLMGTIAGKHYSPTFAIREHRCGWGLGVMLSC